MLSLLQWQRLEEHLLRMRPSEVRDLSRYVDIQGLAIPGMYWTYAEKSKQSAQADLIVFYSGLCQSLFTSFINSHGITEQCRELSTRMGKSYFASLTSIFINLLLQRNKMALELMRDQGEKNRQSPCCSALCQQQLPRTSIGIQLFLNASGLVQEYEGPISSLV